MLKRIYTLIVVVLVAAVTITGIVSFLVVKSQAKQQSRTYLLSAARMVMGEMAGGLSAQQASNRILPAFAISGTNIRVTVINLQGEVTYDSEVDQSTLDNHLGRPEVQEAIRTQGTGTAIRHSATLGEDMFYMALFDGVHQDIIRTALPLKIYQAGLNPLLLTIVLVLAGALIVLALVGFLSTRLISRPLIELKKAALLMAGGQYDIRVNRLSEQRGEIAELSSAYNGMADRLQSVILDLEERNARLDVILNTMSNPLVVITPQTTVTYLNHSAREAFGRNLDPAKAVFPLILLTHREETDQLAAKAMSDRKPAAVECPIRTARGERTYQIVAAPVMTKGREELILTFSDVSESRKLQKMRSEFVANVTHELRTPLTSIRGFIETLRSGAINKPEVAGRFLEIIDIEAERLHQLISDILILSEIEDLKTEKVRENFDLRALISEVVSLLHDAAADRRIDIQVDQAGVPLTVSANPVRIRQILINLIDNAIKYNYEGGQVFIHARRQPDNFVLLTVRDTGPGIPPEQQERVFERFYRIDSGRSREMGGTGLGLSIVKHIAMLYGGTAAVESQPGQGAAFNVRLAI